MQNTYTPTVTTHKTANLVTISPREAQRLLDLPRRNRVLAQKHVDKLAQAMLDGEWQENGQTICVGRNSDGSEILIDGQHRLSACVKANLPLRTYIVKNLDPKVFDTIDSGKRRSMSDVLGILGYENSALLASAVVLFDQYTNQTIKVGGKGMKYPNEYAKTLMDMYPEMPKSVNFIAPLKKQLPIAGSICATAHRIFADIDEEEADDFLVRFAKGIDLSEDSPIRHFREQMFKVRFDKQPWTRYEALAGLIKTWNHVRFDRPVSRSVTRYFGPTSGYPQAK